MHINGQTYAVAGLLAVKVNQTKIPYQAAIRPAATQNTISCQTQKN